MESGYSAYNKERKLGISGDAIYYTERIAGFLDIQRIEKIEEMISKEERALTRESELIIDEFFN